MQRPLSGFEKAFCLSEPLVPINFCIVACLAEGINETNLRQALRDLHKHYSMAAIRLEHDANGNPCFTSEDVPDFPLQVIEQKGDESWQKIATQELGKNFDLQNGPLIRATLLKRHSDFNQGATPSGSDLVLTFHHGIADGMSAVFFLHDLIRLLAEPQSDLPELPQPPDLLELIPGMAKQSGLLKAQVFGMKSGLWLMQQSKHLGLQFKRADRMIDGAFPWQHFGLTGRCLTQAQTGHLVARCRAEGTSIHAAISAAWLQALHELGQGNKRKIGTISSPVNLRGLLDLGDVFGMYMSNAVITADCDPTYPFWDIAREIKAHLDREIQTGRVYRWAFTMMGLMNSPSDVIRQAVPTFATQPVGYDFSVSNLGRLSLPDQGNALKMDCIYGPIVNTSEQELTVGIATINDKLTMTLTYRDFILDSVKAEEMADKVMEILGQATGW